MLSYADYTKRNQITKAIRFELIPQGKTAKTIEEKGDRKYDEALYAALERLKPVIDCFIKDTMKKSLTNIEYDFKPLYKAYYEKDKKAAAREEKELTKIILKSINNALPEKIARISQINSAAFLQDVLRGYVINTKEPKEYKKDEAIKDIEEVNGCTALFSKFLITRITALESKMSNRVIENFKIFCANIPKIKALLAEEEIIGDAIDELKLMASIDYYGQILSPKGIDGYNNIISGDIEEKGTTKKGLNQKINEYNTNIRNQKLDKPYLRTINTLYKQILFPSEKKFSIPFIDSDDDARKTIKEAWETFETQTGKLIRLLNDKNEDSQGNGILIKGNKLHLLSFLLTGDHNKITDFITKEQLTEINSFLNNSALKPSMRKELEKRAEIIQNLTTKKCHELSTLDNAVISEDKSLVGTDKMSAFDMYIKKIMELYSQAKLCYMVLDGGDIFKTRRIKGDRHVQEMLVEFFDALTSQREAFSLFIVPEDEEGKDIAFYNEYTELYSDIRLTYKAENLVRNYITKSLKETAKEKQTCFGNPARFKAGWWNGEKKYSKDKATIIKHDGNYYYFILAGDAKPVEIKEEKDSDTGLLIYKKGQPSYMTLPRALFTSHVVPFFKNNKEKDTYIYSDESVVCPVEIKRRLYDIYANKLFTVEAMKNGIITQEEYKENLYLLIEKYIEFAKAYVQYQKFNLDKFNDPSQYNDIGEFFSDLDTCTSKLSWLNIDFRQIESLVEEGSAYLFLITNKFLRSGNIDKNPYTKTFLSILSKENMDKTTTLLNSNPAIFFRPQVIKKEITHKKGSVMVNRLTENKEPIPKDVYEAIYKSKNNFTSLTKEEKALADEYLKSHKVIWFKAKYDKSARANYMSDKYLLQLTYTKNKDVSDRDRDMLNNRINNSLKDKFNIVSIARSTKDLIYIMVLDNKLTVMEEKSLNVIDGIDYYALLRDTYKEKGENKKAWIYDTENASLKSAYIDLVITHILETAQKYNAIIAIESISDTVKNKYAYLDNQVFRAFEKRIVERLSDYYSKTVKNGAAGSVNNPIQLSDNSGNTYQDGIVYFINGSYTRGIDPTNGFVNLFDFSNLNGTNSKRRFFNAMKNISYTGDSFIFEFDYADFPARYETNNKIWRIQVGKDAVVYDKEKRRTKKIGDVVNELIIPAANGATLSGNIAPKMLDKEMPSEFVEELFKWFRYSIIGYHMQNGRTEEFYRSPIDGKEYDVSSVLAYNLAKKLLFRMRYEGMSKDFTKEWLNSLY